MKKFSIKDLKLNDYSTKISISELNKIKGGDDKCRKRIREIQSISFDSGNK